MLKVKYLLIGYIFLFFFVGQSQGQQKVFVSPDGKDTNEGTINHLFKTLSKAMNEIDKGGIVWLRGGNYEMEKTIWKNWLGNPKIGIPNNDDKSWLKKVKDNIFPKGSNVTIEE